jgi:hypothetical protein
MLGQYVYFRRNTGESNPGSCRPRLLDVPVVSRSLDRDELYLFIGTTSPLDMALNRRWLYRPVQIFVP